MAVCGGVSCILLPSMFVALSKARMASEKGQCHTYSEEADGYVRSEGCGIVILKSIEKVCFHVLKEKNMIKIYIFYNVKVN